MALRATATASEPDLLFLPWDQPLEHWPAEVTIALPRGISRHTVRFVRVNASIYAVKEIEESFARREYGLLFDLQRLGAPCVEPVGIVAGRETADGEALPAALITRHLPYALPYRSLFTPTLRRATAERMLDALVLLLVRLHLLGFAWNDCSLSNTLFRRDAGAFAAWLVDAETGELHESLSNGQRRYDLETAAMNIMGELMDLQAGGMIPEDVDVVEAGDELRLRYEHLWMTLTEPVTLPGGDRTHLHTLVRTLNGLGFDVAEMTLEAAEGGSTLRVRPQVVDAGHHRHRMLRLTGLEMQENQARRLLNDLDSYRCTVAPDEDEQVAAHRWVHDCYEGILRRIPRELRGKLEGPELVHEVLAHRWYSSERAGHDVGLAWAIDDYVEQHLQHARDEAVLIGPAAGEVVDDLDLPDDALPA
ncbi:MAG TPA: DUF4032 domain-containing protein [Candidatus Nanopelagicales bacterium]